MIARTDAEPLIGFRVKAKIGRSFTYGILRSVTPTNRLIIAGERGHETLVELGDVSSLQDGRWDCKICGARVNRVFGDEGRCADCERVAAASDPTPSETCEACGALGAFYSPGAKSWWCAQCHAKRGTLTGLGVEVRVLTRSQQADCRSADLHSLLHDWKKVRSAWLCRSCHVKTHSRPAGTIAE